MWEYFGFTDPAPEAEDAAERKGTKHTALDDKLENRETMEDEALECDYERDCTPLYQNIENENWSAISKFLETGYWPGSFFADTIPPHDQVRTWVTRFDPITTAVRWSQLPLHLAIVVNAPYDVIGSLIELYPQAVRCTDDQHMLPLHLAMRHGSADSVVDLLLAAFPEGVNAKGKNDRTPIDCAIRGPNKIRGRILGTFVERTKAKATKSITNSYTRELAVIKAKLDDKEHELGDVKSKLSALDTAKAALALELEATTKAKKEVEEGQIQAKITTLEAEKAKAKAEEANLMEELANIKMHLATPAASPDETKEEVEKLKAQITEEIQKADGATREELRTMKATVDDLHRAATFAGPETNDSELKSEVDKLREELKSMEDTTKNKVAIALLKEEIEFAVSESNTLTETQIIEARRSLASVKLSELEGKSNEVLLGIKQELEALKREVKDKKLADKTSEDLVRLRQKATDLAPQIKDAQTKQDLAVVQKNLDRVKIGELSAMDDADLMKINKDLRVCKMQLDDIDELITMRTELTDLKKTLEVEVKTPGRKSKAESAAIGSALKELQGAKIQSKTKFELLAMKNELESVQENLKLKQLKEQLKLDVAELKTQTAKQIEGIHNKSMKELMSESTKELVSIQNALDKLDDKSINMKNADEVKALESQVMEWKKTLAEIDRQAAIKSELTDMKKSFEEAMESGRGNTQDMEEMVTKLVEKELAKKTVTDLTDLKTEASQVKNDLKEKESVFLDLETITKTIDDLLEKKEGKQRDDLLTLKSTVDAIDLKDIDTKNEKLWEAMKEEIATLKKELENVDIADKTKEELANLKDALETAINESEEKTKQELTSLKTAVESIDTSKLDSTKHKEWEALKEEVDALKKELKVKECESLLNSLKDQLKSAKGLSRVEISRIKARITSVDSNFSSKTPYELAESKKELQLIAADIPKDAPKSSRWGLKKAASKKAKPEKKKTKTDEKSTSKRPGLFSRLGKRVSKKSPAKASPAKAPTAVSPVTKPVVEPVVEEKVTEDAAVVADTSIVEPADATVKDEPAAEETPKEEAASEEPPAPTEHTEEKKEDDEPPASPLKPPLPPGKVASPTPASTVEDPALAEVPMKRTNSKTVETDGNEVEAVVVES